MIKPISKKRLAPLRRFKNIEFTLSILVVGLCAFFLFYIPIDLKPTIAVSDLVSRADKPISLQVRGLKPFATITLSTLSTDAEGIVWSSRASFHANLLGRVNVDKQRPFEGSYDVADGMGLFWSMKATDKHYESFYDSDPKTIELELLQNQNLLDQVTITRYETSKDIVRIPIAEEGMIGTFFYQKGKTSAPGIIVVGSSHGGLNETKARILASEGYTTLALAYFGVEGLPRNLENIPLEYFKTAIDWFKAKPQVDANRVGITGNSRGGELVLILASLFPQEIHAAIAFVPSHMIFAGMPNQDVPAWTWQGQSLAPLVRLDAPKYLGVFNSASYPIATTPVFLELFKQKSLCEKSEIPVEKIQCPLLLVSSEDDQIWPSYHSSLRIVEKLQESRSSIIYEHVHYPFSGHFLSVPYLPACSTSYFHPVINAWFTGGGSPKDDAIASKQAWEKSLSFFKQHLKN